MPPTNRPGCGCSRQMDESLVLWANEINWYRENMITAMAMGELDKMSFWHATVSAALRRLKEIQTAQVHGPSCAYAPTQSPLPPPPERSFILFRLKEEK